MAQRYPVTVTPVLLPPYTVNLADLVEDKGKPKIMTTIMVNDLTVKNLRVRLHVKMESSGVTIENIKNTAVSPMFIGGGETRILTGIDLAQYLKLDNLEFHGYSKEKYLQTGQLPGGLWRLTIEIQDFDSGRQLSNRGMFTAWVSVYDPPQLLAPRDNVEAPDNASLPLVFSWLASKHTGGIVPVQYKLEVWRLNMEYLPAQTWVESQTPIYTATTSATSFTAIPAALNLEPGQRYCWRVTVIDPTGQAQINKDGESEVRTFVYQHTCPDVTDIDISVNNTRVDFSWNGSSQHSYYQVDLVDMNGSSTLKDCYDTRFTYYDFERGSNWKVSVKAVCPGGLESDWATYQDFSIDPPGTTPTVEECPDCGCAEAPEQQTIENQNLKELKANDTIVNRTGRTRFIIVNATDNGDGSYNGQFHLWLELWKVKVLCDYTDLKVNTDGVILDGQWRSVNNPALMINTAELASTVVQLKNDIATVTYDNSIRDTVMLVDAIQTIYKDEEGHYQAVLDNGEVKDVTTQLENKGRTLITDSEGNQMVLTSDHQIMSTEQYKATGKNNTLISNSNSEKDKQVSTGKVTFAKADGQKYGFDAYSADNAYDAVYPALEGGYRPAYKSIAKWQTDVVYASPMDKVSFRNQMGAPYAVKNGTIELRGDATPGESPVYAHVAETDSTTKVVGKLNLLTFDEKQVQLCLVPVNGARLPNASELQAELNSIFAPAVASVTVTTHSGLTMAYANGQNFVHGGSGWLSVYNADQKAAIQALTDAQDDVYYLFFVDNATKLDENDKPTIVAGYMPICRRYGFIYDNPTSKYVAHEVSHGAFSLHHTFSSESESYHAPQGTTPNLMDYSGGTDLNHLQWQWMHESHTNLLGFLDDESEGELNESNNIVSEILKAIHDANAEGKDVCLIKKYGIENVFMTTAFSLNDKQIKALVTKHNANELEINCTKSSCTIQKQARNSAFGQEGNFTTLTFYNNDYDNALEILVEDENADELCGWLFGGQGLNTQKYEIQIVTTLIEENDKNTFSRFVIDNGAVSGYFIEREGGTYDEERTDKSLKRIPAGKYEVVHNDCKKWYDDRGIERRKNCANEFRLITTKDNCGTRTGILIHRGGSYIDSKGCLLPVGDGYTIENKTKENKETIETYNVYYSNGTTEETLNAINKYVREKENLYGAENVSIFITINR